MLGTTIGNELMFDEHINNVCMFYNRTTNNKINKLHEGALRLVYDDHASSFDELLEKDSSLSVHHFNIQTLCIELCKVYNNVSQTVFSELFLRNH